MTLTLREEPTQDLDLSPLTPDRLAGCKPRDIGAMKIPVGTRRVNLGDLFDIRGREPAHIVLTRGSERFVRAGREMTRGLMEIHGHGGHYLGQGLLGGRIHVHGDTGDWTAAGLSGGVIQVDGDAGNFTGAPLAGAGSGMRNGDVIIGGSAGDRLGDAMRSGTIVVLGGAGEFCGSGMRAGTIVVLGRCGRHAGFAMRRGTIVLGRKPNQIPITFQSCGKLKMEFLRLLFKQVSNKLPDLAFFRGFGPEAHRFAGDRAVGGRGEILLLLNAAIPARAC